MERAAAIIVGCVGVLILTIGAVFWVQSRRSEPSEVDLLAAAAAARAAGGGPEQRRTAPTGAAGTPSPPAAAPTTGVTAAAPTTTVAVTAPTTAPAVDGRPSAALAGVIERINHGGLRFAYRSATLEPAAITALDELATLLLAEPSVHLVVLGHTDSDGELAENEQLSALRATAVVGHLAAAGVAVERLTALAMGETVPIASNDDEAGREANRRVDLLVGAPS